MASIYTDNITLNRKVYADFIEFCDTTGAYLIIVKAEKPLGAFATFHIAGGTSHKMIKRVASVSGKDGEELIIKWQDDSLPILSYEDPKNAPVEDLNYNLKII
jgi:hypothetical protein